MDKRKLKHIADSIPRLPYLECFQFLQLISINYDIDVDFDCIYINAVDTLPIAAIYGVIRENDYLYILTKNNQLHYISLNTKEHNIIELNDNSILDKIITKFKQLFNY